MIKNLGKIGSSALFGLKFSCLSEQEVAEMVTNHPRTAQQGVGLIITPNIQHIALLQDNLALQHACKNAALLTYDGFPLVCYAKLRNQPVVERTTGRGIVQHILAHPEKLHTQKMFMVLDSTITMQATQSWARKYNLEKNIDYVVPPHGFENNSEYCKNLLSRIKIFETSILFMGLGAPKSEIFIDQHKNQLPPCWALCIGQAILVAVGCRPSPPKFIQALNLEWLWRIKQEPKRLLGRYIKSGWAFLHAILKDLTCRD